MKHSRWFAFSVGLNCVLAGGLIWATATRRVARPAWPDAWQRSMASSNLQKQPNPQGTEFAAAAANPADPLSAEWPRWLAQLRTAGVSRHVLAGLVVADFDRRWDERHVELQRQYEAGEIDAEDVSRDHAERERAKEAELRLALGDEGFRRWDKENVLRDFSLSRIALSIAEGDELYDLRKKSQEQRAHLEQANRRGEIDDADLSERLTAVETTYHDRLKALIGQERYETLQGANEDLTADLRRQTRDLQIEPAQLTALADLQRARDEMQSQLAQLESAPAGGTGFEARREAIDAARDREFERVLGPAAFAEFEKQNDRRYRLMKHYAAAWQLTEPEIAQLYGTIQSYEKTVRHTRQQALLAEQQGRPTDWATVQRGIDYYTQQTEQNLRSALGPERYELLKRNDAIGLEK